MVGTLYSIQSELEEDEDIKDVFFDGGYGSLSVVKRIRNAPHKTTFEDSKHSPTHSQEQETLSRWSVIGKVSFTHTVIEDVTEIADSQEDCRDKKEANEEITGEKQGKEKEFEWPLSDSRDATQLIKDLINNGRKFLNAERVRYSSTEYRRWKSLITCLIVLAGRTIENK